MKRTKQEAEMTRRAILESASVIFRTQGYFNSTLEDIARQAGVTRGAVYWHFDNKYDILCTLFREYQPRIIVESAKILDSDRDPLARVEDVIGLLIKNIDSDHDMKEYQEISRLLKELPCESPQLLSMIDEKNHCLNELLSKTIREGVKYHQMREDLDPEMTAMALSFLIRGVWTRWFEKPGSFSPDAIAGPITHIFMSGIRC